MKYSYYKKICSLLLLSGVACTAQAMDIVDEKKPNQEKPRQMPVINEKIAKSLCNYFTRKGQSLCSLSVPFDIFGVIGNTLTPNEIYHLLNPRSETLANVLAYLGENRGPSKTISLNAKKISSFATSHDGMKLVIGLSNNQVNLLDASSGKCLKTLCLGENLANMDTSSSVRSVGVSQDGTKIIASSSEAKLQLCNLSDGAISSLSSSESKGTINRDGTHIAISTDEGLILVNAHTSKVLCHILEANAFSFSLNGEELYVVADNTITTIGVKTGDAMGSVTLATEEDLSYTDLIAFNEGATKVVFILKERKMVEVFERSTGRKLLSCPVDLKGDDFSLSSLWRIALHPDGTKVLLVSRKNNTAILWDIAKGTKICSLVGHKGGLLSAVFRGEEIITNSYDGTVKIWNLSTFDEIKGCISLSLFDLLMNAYKAKKEKLPYAIKTSGVEHKALSRCTQSAQQYLIDALSIQIIRKEQ